MEVAISSPNRDFDFDFNGIRTSPYLSAPSSPQRFGNYYLSAPTSPSRFSEFDYFNTIDAVSAKHHHHHDGDGDDADYSFAFHVSQESERSSLSAAELFDGGKIKPLKPQPQPQSRSPWKKTIRDVFSPKKEETREGRGRDRTPAAMSSSNSSRRATRSLSPYRNSEYAWEEEQRLPQQRQSSKEESNPSASLTSSSSSSKSSRKWRLRDFLLFRSASEGRGSSKDPLRKYSVLYKKPEEAKNSSFRSIDSSSSGPGSKRRISAHEFHYAMKKAESNDLKKKTYLPYRQGILGRLAGFGS